MGTISIYCEQKSLFTNPDDKFDEVLVNEFSFSTVPAWVTKTYLWELLVKDNKVKIIRDVEDVKEIEDKELKKEASEIIEKKEEPVIEEESEVNDNELVDLTGMTAKQLYALCKDNGLEAEKQKSKAYYLEILANNGIK